MIFNIYSVGDGKLLSDILNAVAMICNHTSFTSLIFAGFMIGIIVIAFQCLISGGRVINLHFALIAMILYMGLFGTKCSVVVSDAYDDKVYEKIDHMPLAVGVTGMAISNIGHGLASMFEQGFGDVTRTDNFAYAEPLRILNQFRTFTESDEVFARLDQSLGGDTTDTRQSVINYISECVMPNIATGGTTVSAIYKGDLEAFSSEDEMKMTYLAIPNGGNLTCKDAFPKFKAIFNPLTADTKVITWVNRVFGVEGTTDYDHIQNAITDLSTVNQSVQNWMTMSLLRVQYDHAADQYYRRHLDTASALAINQTILQKSYQQASEQTLFLVSARAMMALIEGMVYAITPLVAFLICTGSFGLGLTGKYLSMLVWIQLWLPVMRITDMYIRAGARDAINATFLTADQYSFFTNDAVGAAVQNWIGIGGMAAGATPIIALFLVTGSSVAFTSMTNRMLGADQFNEKAMAPDITSTPPVLNQAGMANADRTRGALGTGAEAVLPKINGSQQGAMLVSAAQTNTANKTSSFNSTYEEMATTGTGGEEMRSFNRSWGDFKMSQLAQTDSALHTKIQTIAKQHGWSEDQTNEAVGQLSMQLGLGIQGGIGTPGGKEASLLKASLGISGDITGQGTQSQKASSGDSASVNSSDSTASNQSQQLASQLASGARDAVQNTKAASLKTSGAKSQSGRLGTAYSAVKSAQQSEIKAASQHRAMSTSQTMDVQQVAHNLSDQEKANLASYVRGNDAAMKEINKNFDKFTNPNGPYYMNDSDARAAATLTYLAGSQNYDDQMMLAKTAYSSELASAGLLDPVKVETGKIGGPEDTATAKANAVKNAAENKLDKVDKAIPAPTSSVKELHEAGVSSVKTGGHYNDSIVNNKKAEESWRQIKRADYSRAQSIASMLGQKGLAENFYNGATDFLPPSLRGKAQNDPMTRSDTYPNNTWEKPDTSIMQAVTNPHDPTAMPKTPLVMDFASQKQWEFAESVRQNATPQVIAAKSAAVREEVMKARWGSDVKESDLSKGDIEELNRATRGLQANLINAMNTEQQGNTTKIHNFNTDLGISTAKNSRMY